MNNVGFCRPLPQTSREYVAQSTPSRSSIHDMVEQLHIKLYDNKEYRNLFEAITDERSVNGKVIFDRYEAAKKVKEFAVKEGVVAVAMLQADEIRKSLNVVMKRGKIDIKSRTTTPTNILTGK